MATLEQENSSVLDLNLSLGGLFSQLPCTRLKHSDSNLSHSQDFHQQKRGRTLSYQEHTSDDDSSGHLSIASCSIPASNPEHLSLRSDKSVKENDVHSPSNGSTHRMLSSAKKAMMTDQVHCGFGSTSIVSHMLPTKRKASFENEEGTICRSNSAELENGVDPDEGSTTRKKALVLEAPRSRCGSNSDLLGSVDPVAEKLSRSCMMYLHPSAMLPVQGPYSVPVQWGGFNLPYPMQYSSHMVPPHSYFPWIAPFVADSSSGLRPSVPAASCFEGKLKETFSKEAALTAAPLSKKVVLQDVSQIRKLPLAAVYTAIPMSENEVCTSASSLRPSCSVSPTSNYSSDVCTSPRQPLMSATSLVTNCSSDSIKQVDPAKEESGLDASFSSPTQEGCLKSVLCPRPLGNSVCGQSKHSLPTGRKPIKTVRFCCVERDLEKSGSSEKKMLTSSSFKSRNQLVKKMKAVGKEVLCNLLQRSGSVSNRTKEECKEEESDDSRITSESSDQDESVLLVKGEGGAGKLGARIAASWPRVSTTCAGLNGKTICGVMYITESKQACLICSCHGTHMSPTEFVQHSGSTDLRNPERSIVISGLSYVKQVV